MTSKRIVQNRNRPAQPEPDEDPAAKKKPVREQGTKKGNPRHPEPERK